MFESIFKEKDKDNRSIEMMLKQMDMRYAQLAIELEKLKALNQKVERISDQLQGINSMMEDNGIDIQTPTKSTKTIDAIKLILQKHGEMTASELSGLIKLSRTRCNEYLKQMEDESILVSKTISRRKIYGIRQ